MRLLALSSYKLFGAPRSVTSNAPDLLVYPRLKLTCIDDGGCLFRLDFNSKIKILIIREGQNVGSKKWWGC